MNRCGAVMDVAVVDGAGGWISPLIDTGPVATGRAARATPPWPSDTSTKIEFSELVRGRCHCSLG